jgi:TRAP-type C4-dicarboxylate transport system permease small subunit
MPDLTNRLSLYLTYLAAAALVMMMVHVMADIVGRQFFSAPAPATTEFVAYYYMIAVVFLPIPLIEARGRSIAVELVYDMLPEFVKRSLRGFALLCGIGFFGALAYKTSLDAMTAYSRGEMVDAAYRVAIWPGRFLLPLSMGLAVIVLILRLIGEVIFNQPPRYDQIETATQSSTKSVE